MRMRSRIAAALAALTVSCGAALAAWCGPARAEGTLKAVRQPDAKIGEPSWTTA